MRPRPITKLARMFWEDEPSLLRAPSAISDEEWERNHAAGMAASMLGIPAGLMLTTSGARTLLDTKVPDDLIFKGNVSDIDHEVELAKARAAHPDKETSGGHYARRGGNDATRESVLQDLWNERRPLPAEDIPGELKLPKNIGGMADASPEMLEQAKTQIRHGQGLTYDEIAESLGFSKPGGPLYAPHQIHSKGQNAYFVQSQFGDQLADAMKSPSAAKDLGLEHHGDEILGPARRRGLINIGSSDIINKADVVAHELGHATKEGPGLLNKLRRFSGTGAGRGLGMGLGAGGLYMAATGDTDATGHVPASMALASIPAAQVLGEEGLASVKALKGLKSMQDQGRISGEAYDAARKRLFGAWKTYAGHGLLPSLAVGGLLSLPTAGILAARHLTKDD